MTWSEQSKLIRRVRNGIKKHLERYRDGGYGMVEDDDGNYVQWLELEELLEDMEMGRFLEGEEASNEAAKTATYKF